ncbi:hypothetical protein PSN78_002787, partial [Enterococcus faecalis]|nr:hypothetical protein [Enterococcus faecalis]
MVESILQIIKDTKKRVEKENKPMVIFAMMSVKKVLFEKLDNNFWEEINGKKKIFVSSWTNFFNFIFCIVCCNVVFYYQKSVWY